MHMEYVWGKTRLDRVRNLYNKRFERIRYHKDEIKLVLRWLGYIEKVGENRIEKQVLNGSVDGKGDGWARMNVGDCRMSKGWRVRVSKVLDVKESVRII
jgi:hypothetical protein